MNDGVGRMMSPSQAAARLGISACRIRQLVKQGALDCTFTPLGRLIPVQEVERLKKERLEVQNRRK